MVTTVADIDCKVMHRITANELHQIPQQSKEYDTHKKLKIIL